MFTFYLHFVRTFTYILFTLCLQLKVDNTDAEGRLILADALTYADTFKPKLVLDVATLTGAMAVAIGGAASGVYSTTDANWDLIRKASFSTGDRVWRMPLWNFYTQQMKSAIISLTDFWRENSIFLHN